MAWPIMGEKIQLVSVCDDKQDKRVSKELEMFMGHCTKIGAENTEACLTSKEYKLRADPSHCTWGLRHQPGTLTLT